MNENTFNIVGYLKKDFQTNATVVISILAKEYAAIVKKWPYPASLFSSFQHRLKQLDSCQWLDSNGGRLYQLNHNLLKNVTRFGEISPFW